MLSILFNALSALVSVILGVSGPQNFPPPLPPDERKEAIRACITR